MASTYVNNLRLEEIGTGEQSGTWGDTTNTNLEIIGQAVAWGERAIANASSDNITIADGALDADRCLGLKLTGGGQACLITLLPNTSSKTWFMYNATAAALTFTCGGGANVIIPAGQTKVIATDGLGSGGVVHDLLTAVNLAGTTTVDDLTVSDTALVTGVLTTTAATVFNGGFASNAASSIGGTTPTLTIGDAGAEDAKIVFDGNAADYHVGLDDSEDALQIGLGAALGTTPRITIRAAEVVVNDLGIDLDFRVEGDADTHALFVEGETDRVSIGSNDPPMKLTVRNGSANSDIAKFTGDGTGAGLTISTAATTRADDTVVLKASDAFGEFSFVSDSTEVLRLDKDNNVVISNSGGSLFTATAGTSNFRAGVNAGNSIASGGIRNTVIGDEAGTALTTGDANTAVGYLALAAEDAHGQNTAIGCRALAVQDAGASAFNTAVGADAGLVISTGTHNTLIGGVAGDALTVGVRNVAVGFASLSSDDVGSRSTAIGYQALNAQNYAGSTAVNSNNTAVGYEAGLAVSTGTGNTYIGTGAGDGSDDGANNVALGFGALSGNQGNNNVAIGEGAAIAATGATNTVVGSGACGGSFSASGTVAVGRSAGNGIAGGNNNICIGNAADVAASGQVNGIALGVSITAAANDFTFGKNGASATCDFDADAVFTHSSDLRLKTNIADAVLGLAFVNDLRPVTYKWKAAAALDANDAELAHLRKRDEDGNLINCKNTELTMHGLIAQEVKTALDTAGVSRFKGWSEDQYGVQGISNEMYVIPLIKAVQELSTALDAALARIATLEG